MHAALACVNVEYGRLLGLVSRAVFKTVERLLESLVCSIRTAFRQLPARAAARYATRDIYLRHALFAGIFALLFDVCRTRRRDRGDRL
jgi:Flp pilus assembly pilin Flp